jgi:hypothetical protein
VLVDTVFQEFISIIYYVLGEYLIDCIKHKNKFVHMRCLSNGSKMTFVWREICLAKLELPHRV